MEDKITQVLLKKYFGITQEALEKIKILPPERTHLRKSAEDFMDMAKRYSQDARHFEKKGDLVRAYGALNYAHAWLDAGARMGLFDVDHDDRLFTVD